MVPSEQARRSLPNCRTSRSVRVLVLQLDVPAGVVLNAGQGQVDFADPVHDVLPAAVQERVERHHLVDGVLVQRLLEVSLEPRQIVAHQLLQQPFVVGRGLQGRHRFRWSRSGTCCGSRPSAGPSRLRALAIRLDSASMVSVSPDRHGAFHCAGVLVGERLVRRAPRRRGRATAASTPPSSVTGVSRRTARHSSIASTMSLASFSLAPSRCWSLSARSSSRSSFSVSSVSLAVSCCRTSLVDSSAASPP